jgi:hypothetical protein
MPPNTIRHNTYRRRWKRLRDLYGARDEQNLAIDVGKALTRAGYSYDANEDDCNRIRRWGAHVVEG